MDSYGIVTETRGDRAKVKVQRQHACQGCGACGAFAGSDTKKELEIEALNPIGARRGELVKLETQLKDMLLAAFVLYIVPLISFFFGLFIGLNWRIFGFISSTPEINGILTGLLGMFLTLLYIRRWDYRKLQRGRRFKAIIREVVAKEGEEDVTKNHEN
ncbi:MAG: SoxR reducing system RseC family protein [Firmicutes bacterium]|nr:SoxR reducing system RseC family protein [Bacillota bacterium]